MYLEKPLKKVMASVLGISPDAIGPDTSQDNVTGWDSMKHMELILALEEEFGITIPDEDVVNLTSYELTKLVIKELTERK